MSARHDRGGVLPLHGEPIRCPAKGCGRALGLAVPPTRRVCPTCGVLVGYDGGAPRVIARGPGTDRRVARTADVLRRQLDARKRAGAGSSS